MLVIMGLLATGYSKEETERATVTQDFYSMPGVALRRGEYYQVDLADDEIFKAVADYTYSITFKLRQRLDVLHPDPKKDGIQLQKPLGREKVVAEVHFPLTRKLTKVGGKVQLEVYEVRASGDKQIDSTKFIVNTDQPIDAIPGKFTDMFRLTLPHPPQDADIRIMWQWSRNAEIQTEIRPGTGGELTQSVN